MTTFRLEMDTSHPSDLRESISVHVDIETWKTLRRIIKDFLKARDYL